MIDIEYDFETYKLSQLNWPFQLPYKPSVGEYIQCERQSGKITKITHCTTITNNSRKHYLLIELDE